MKQINVKRSSQFLALVAIVSLTACGGGGGSSSVSGSVATATPSPSTAPSQTATPFSTATPSTAPSSTATPIATATPTPVATINPAAVPLGDGMVSTSAQTGYVYSCATSFNGQGATTNGPWINTAAGTWSATAKIAVQGSVSWTTTASNSMVVSGNNFVITTNDLPNVGTTGTFPIAKSDPAYAYDQNGNSVAAQNLMFTLPMNPAVASTPSCLPNGPIGIFTDGVVMFNALDALGRDGGAHEVFDSCNGHPAPGNQYHHHEVPACIADVPDSTGHSGLYGYAFDGFAIYGLKGTGGTAVTDASLDACHGHTHAVLFHGTTQTIYHYHLTVEYPYTLGCYKGTPIAGF